MVVWVSVCLYTLPVTDMCNGFGIDGPTVVAVGGVCLVLAVATSPIWVTGGVLYGGYKAGEYTVKGAARGAHAAASAVKDMTSTDPERAEQRRTTNVLKKVKNRMVKRLKAGEWQAYLQEIYERTKEKPSRENLHELGVAMLLADDALKAEQYLDEALKAEPANPVDEKLSWGRLARIHFARGLANQTIHDFEDAIIDFTSASDMLPREEAKTTHPMELEAERIKEIFRAYDTDGDGLISHSELERVLLALDARQEWSKEELNDMFFNADKNGDDMLSYEEFVDWAMLVNLPTTITDPESHLSGQRLPPLSRAECLNSLGYAQYLQALYVVLPERRTQSAFCKTTVETLLTAACDNFAKAVAETEGPPRAMFIYNMGRAKYYLALMTSIESRQGASEEGLLLNEKEKELMSEALGDFRRCVAITNFNTAAEGWAMCAQAHAVLGNVDEAQASAKRADEIDPRVFLVDIASFDELLLPWPLPKSNQAQEDECHSFEERSFKSPHFCDHCLKLIRPFSAAYCCTRCEFRVHGGGRPCFGKASKLRTCWKEKGGFSVMDRLTQGKEVEARESHVHKMKYVWFHKPTWCDECRGYVHRPHGYHCIECGYRTHKNCLDDTKCVVVG